MPTEIIEVAIVLNSAREFFVVANDRWNGCYCFPMSRQRLGTDPNLGVAALDALRTDSGARLFQPQATFLDAIEVEGISQRTQKPTRYLYRIFEIKIDHKEIETPLPEGSLASACGFLSYDELQRAERVTWSTKLIAFALVAKQHVSASIVTRLGEGGREFLMLDHAAYGGYFFPVKRVRALEELYRLSQLNEQIQEALKKQGQEPAGLSQERQSLEAALEGKARQAAVAAIRDATAACGTRWEGYSSDRPPWFLPSSNTARATAATGVSYSTCTPPSSPLIFGCRVIGWKKR